MQDLYRECYLFVMGQDNCTKEWDLGGILDDLEKYEAQFDE